LTEKANASVIPSEIASPCSSRPENPAAFPIEFTLGIGDQEIIYSLEPRFRKVDRVAGEVTRALAKALAYAACGKHAQACYWARELVRLLECADILN
jgi:hypothetical protein